MTARSGGTVLAAHKLLRERMATTLYFPTLGTDGTNDAITALAPQDGNGSKALLVAPAKPDQAATLALAIQKSQGVQEKVEACAGDLGAATNVVKKNIAEGEITPSAHAAVVSIETVEIKVQECADDLQQVNETLAHGLQELEQTETELTITRSDLEATKAALAASREQEKQTHLRSMHDSTTGLPNRDLFDDRLAHAIALAERHQWTLAVMFLDLDKFKEVNDTYGHASGDIVLKMVASRLLHNFRDEDTVCRNGGDEFLYLLMNPRGTDNVSRIAHGVLRTIGRPIELEANTVTMECSIGVAMYPANGLTGELLIKSADAAMYKAKKSCPKHLAPGRLMFAV